MRKKALPMTGGSGDSWTRTNDPIDVNDVLYRLSHATMSFSEHFSRRIFTHLGEGMP